MNKLGYPVRWMDSMSLGRRRGCYRACARWLAWPLCASHIEASYEMGAPSIFIRGAQVCWSRLTLASSLLSTDVPLLSLGSLAFFFFFGCPSKEPPRLSQVLDLASFSSNLAWPVGQNQCEDEEEEEEERQEVAFWEPLSNFLLCSCWLTGLSN